MVQPEIKYGIALSGGGARGLAHAGVLKALNEHGIFPEFISGVSAGAIIGALYADGYKPDQILELFIKKDLLKLLKLKRPKLGFFSAEGLKNILEQTLRVKNFDELKLELTVCATNLAKAQSVYFNSGNIVDAVMASSAFPILLKPYAIQSTLFIDGGIMDNLPVKPLLNRNLQIIGVYVNPIREEQSFKNARNYADRILHMGLRANMVNHINQCNIYFEPPALTEFTLFKVTSAETIFNIGYDYASQLLASVK